MNIINMSEIRLCLLNRSHPGIQRREFKDMWAFFSAPDEYRRRSHQLILSASMTSALVSSDSKGKELVGKAQLFQVV